MSNQNSSNYGSYGASGGSDEYLVPVKAIDDVSEKSTERSYSSDDSFSELDSLIRRQSTSEKSVGDRFFQMLGFTSSPFKRDSSVANDKASDMRLAMLSNFSTSYNIVSISLALDIMQDIYPSTPNDKSMCSSALIAGMIVGQLFGGAVGDLLGRHLAMAVVMGLQVVGALVTSLSQDGYFSIYLFLTCKYRGGE
jgi:hypothetical protein